MRVPTLLVMSFAFALPLLAQADTITISKSIPFAEDSGASDAVKDECGFETRVPEYLKKAAKGDVDVVLSKDSLEATEGKVLFLEVTNMFGLGGGAYSGSKSAIVSGKLHENGELIGSVQVRRRSIMGMMPGTCSIMKRIAKKIGKDIAVWLQEPTMDAMLGDFEEEEDDEEETEKAE
jgi:hypothetical protein